MSIALNEFSSFVVSDDEASGKDILDNKENEYTSKSPLHHINDNKPTFLPPRPTSAPVINDQESPFNQPDESLVNDSIGGEADKSMESLLRSLASMKLGSKSSSSVNTIADNTTLNSSFDETQRQLNDDIHFDVNSDTSSKTSHQLQSRASSNASPWRKFRSSAAPTIPELKVGLSDFKLPPPGTDNNNESSTAVETISELNKQITNYKIQIRFFKQFLQKLIEQRELNENDLDLNELNQLNGAFGLASPVKSAPPKNDENKSNKAELEKLHAELEELSNSYNEIFKLNEDLYDSMEKTQNELIEKEAEFKKCDELADDIIQVLLDNDTTDSTSKKLLSRSLEGISVDAKLQAIQMELHKQIELKHDVSLGEGMVADPVTQKEIDKHIQTILQLMGTVQQLRTQFNDQMEKLKGDLDFETEQSEKLRANNSALRQNIDELSRIVDHSMNPDESNHLKDEIYHLNEDLLSTTNELHNLQHTFDTMHDNYMKLKEQSSVLKSQLELKTQELTKQKSEQLDLKKYQQKLDLEIERQRILKAEKTSLSYKVQQLTSNKKSLQDTIQNLNDKIADMQLMDTTSNKNNSTMNLLEDNISVLEDQLVDLMKFDIDKFEALLESLDKAVDDLPLKEAMKKMNYMTSKLDSLSRNPGALANSLLTHGSRNFSDIKERHKSVFDFLTRAVKATVEDDIQWQLKEKDRIEKAAEYTNKLLQRIDVLTKSNDELSRLSSFSGTQELRINELTNRWKAEREARVYEYNEAERRLKELEAENNRLREKLNITSR